MILSPQFRRRGTFIDIVDLTVHLTDPVERRHFDDKAVIARSCGTHEGRCMEPRRIGAMMLIIFRDGQCQPR
jgi:hypothetical protein